MNSSSPKKHLPTLKERVSPGSHVRIESDSSSMHQALDVHNHNVNKLKNQDVKVKLYERTHNFQAELPPLHQRQVSGMIECAQSSAVESKINAEFDCACFLILH